MLLVSEILGKCDARANTGHSCGKATGNSLDGPESWVAWSFRESPGQGEQCEPGFMEYHIRSLPARSIGGGLRKGIMAPTSTSLSEKAALPSPCPNARYFSSSLCVLGAFQAVVPVLDLRKS